MHRYRITPYLAQAVLLVAALIPIFPGVFLRGEILVPSSYMYDYAPWSFHRPADLPRQNPLGAEVPLSVCVWYKLTDDAFDNGEWPLWNPLQFMGAPLLANFQSAIFYPPRLLFRLMNDTHVAMTLYILLRFWLCGFNAYVCARLLQLETPFANLFSFAYMLAGYNMLWTFYPPPDVMAWLPLLFAATESLLNARYRIGMALLTIGLPLSILAGHPSSVMMGCLGLGMYASLRLAIARGPVSRSLRTVTVAAGAMALSLAICAVQLLPFIEYMPHMELFIYRFIPEGVSHYKYSIFDLLSAWAPRLLGTEFEGTLWGTTNHTYLGMLYVGIPVWLCVSLLFARLDIAPAVRVRLYSMLAVAAACVYLATDFPGTSVIQGLPIISGSRPAYFLAFPTLAIPLVGAHALQAWMYGERQVRDLAKPALAVLVAMMLAFAGILAARYLSVEFIAALSANPGFPAYIAKQCAIGLAFTGVSFLIVAARATYSAHARTLGYALCVVLIADQAVSIFGLMGTTPRKYVFPDTRLTDFLRSQETPCRVRLFTGQVPLGYAALYGIEEPDGYDAVYPKRAKPYFEQLNTTPGTPVSALLSCAFTLFPDAAELPAGYSAVTTIEGITVAENPNTLPRVRLVDRVEEFTSSDSMFAKMNQSDFNPHATVYTDEPLDFVLPASDNSPAGDAEFVDWRPDFVTIAANAKKECVLVLADAYYPGWEAFVDGTPARIFPAYHIYRGVHLTAGKHTVEFRYRPASFRYGLLLSFAGIAVAFGLALVVLSRSPGANR